MISMKILLKGLPQRWHKLPAFKAMILLCQVEKLRLIC